MWRTTKKLKYGNDTTSLPQNLRMHALLKRALRAYKAESRSGNGEPDVEQRRVTVTNVSLRFHCRLGSCFDTSRRRPYGFTKTSQRGFSEVLNGLFFSVCGVVVHSMEGEQHQVMADAVSLQTEYVTQERECNSSTSLSRAGSIPKGAN